MKTEILNVNGMSCSHCERAINDAVGELDGVMDVKSDANSKSVSVTFDEEKVSLNQIKEAITEEGYNVVD